MERYPSESSPDDYDKEYDDGTMPANVSKLAIPDLPHSALTIRWPTLSLLNEVQASRKLVADLLALHKPYKWREWTYCEECCRSVGADESVAHPCETVKLIEASGCSEVTP